MGEIGDRVRSAVERSFHLVVRSRSGDEGFALFGGHRPRHHFSRVYLNTADPAVSLRLNGSPSVTSAERLLRRYGLVVFCGGTVPEECRSDAIHTTNMIGLSMPLPSTLDGPLASWGTSVRADLSKIRRGRFQYEIEHDPEVVEEFYRRFYVPSMTRRWDAEAHICSRTEMQEYARSPGAEFLRVMQDGEWVAGCFNRSDSEGYRFQVLGWRDGDPRLIGEGVVAAIYWFGIRRAVELGHTRLALGPASPYLEDGLLVFKGKWGARFDTSRKYGNFHLLLDPAHAACRRFLAAHSLLAQGDNGDVIVYSSRRPEEVKAPRSIMAGVSRWYRWLERPQLSGTTAHDEVPRSLRPWLVEEPLPKNSGGGSKGGRECS
jgi:hypothetical protein